MSAPSKAQTPNASPELWPIAEAGDVKTRSRRSISEGMFHDFSDSDVAPRGSNQGVRTLHEPPEIWNLVPETRSEFNPRSAFLGHINSLKHVVLFAIMLIFGAVAAFGFMKLWDLAGTPHARSTAPAPSSVSVPSTTPVAPSPPVAVADGSLPANDGNTNIAPNSVVTEPKRTTDTSTSEIARSKVDTKTTVPAPTAAWVPGRKVVSKRQGENRLSSAVIGQAAAERADEKAKTQISTTPVPKPDNEKVERPAAAQKEEIKAPNPQLVAPAKVSNTPKPKVIQWP